MTAAWPLPGECWEHVNGGTVHVVERRPKTVLVTIRAPHKKSVTKWIRLSTFRKVVKG
jgi:hypothetical protein